MLLKRILYNIFNF